MNRCLAQAPQQRCVASMHHKGLVMSADCRDRACGRPERGRESQTNRGSLTLEHCGTAKDRQFSTKVDPLGSHSTAACVSESTNGLRIQRNGRSSLDLAPISSLPET